MKIQNLLNNAKILFIVLLSGFCFQANAQVDSADFKMRIDSLMNQGKSKRFKTWLWCKSQATRIYSISWTCYKAPIY